MSISRSEKLHKRYSSDILSTNFEKKCGIGRFSFDGLKAEWRSGVLYRTERKVKVPVQL